jgi:hypothetical protein
MSIEGIEPVSFFENDWSEAAVRSMGADALSVFKRDPAAMPTSTVTPIDKVPYSNDYFSLPAKEVVEYSDDSQE